VEFQLESYLPVRESVTISENTGAVSRKLTPDFGWLSVYSDPSGLAVTLDGRPAGTTPVTRRQVGSGPHRVLVTDSSYYDKGKEVVVDRGEHEEVEVKLSPRQGGLRIGARDPQGNDLRATVLVDGEEAGRTPFSDKVLVGEHRLRVVLGEASWEKKVTVREKEVEELVATLNVSEGVSGRAPVGPHARRLFHLGLALSEGAVMVGDELARTGVIGTLSAGLDFGWLRLEAVHAGISFEGTNPIFLGTGAAFALAGGLFARTMLDLAIASGDTFWGLTAGLGYAFALGSGWHLDTELDVSVWPGEVVAVPLEGRMGVRYGF